MTRPAPVVTQPVVTRILETSLYVEEIGRSQVFYERIFGFGVLRVDERMCALAIPGREVLLLFRAGGSCQPSQTPGGIIPPHDGHGTQHLCFGIAREQLPAWETHLRAQGIAVESRIEWPRGGTSLYFRDPDGHSLEVGTPGLWSNDPAL